MTQPIVLVADAGAEPSAHPVLPRFRALLERHWDAHLVLARGVPEELPGLESLPEQVLRERVHPPPLRLRRRAARRALARRLATTAARAPRAVLREVAPAGHLPNRYCRAAVAALRPDLVHVQSAADAIVWASLTRALRARLVVSLRWDDVGGTGLSASRDGEIWAAADGFQVDSDALDAFGRERGRPDRPLAVVTPEPDPALLALPRTEVRPGPTLRVLSVGPLSWTRGYEHAVRALRLLTDRGVDCAYRIVGAGEFADAVAFARHQLGLVGVVDISAAADPRALLDHFGWADVVLNAAVVPTSPKPLLDASACGRAIVTTEVPERMVDAAILVPRRDPEAIATELGRLADDPGRRARLGEAARALLRLDGEHESVDRFEQLYRQTLRGAR